MSLVPSFWDAHPSLAKASFSRSHTPSSGLIAAIHVAALGIMLRTEDGWVGILLFLLTWALLNCGFLALLRRPVMSAALSLLVVAGVVMLSQFKFSVMLMVINFFDVLIVDSDTVSFLLSIFPDLRTALVLAALLAIPLLIVIWRMDPFRVMRRLSLSAAATCGVVITGLSLGIPEMPWAQFWGLNHLSTFVRSGITTVYEVSANGWIDFDRGTAKEIALAAGEPCRLAGKPPHIIMVLDEASFDITAAPGVAVPADYKSHFRSSDGKARSLIVEGTGGPTWYTEYNVLTGLSARSYGRLSYYVTRIAAGRVERGLPQALRRCGYKTVTLYPAYGAFLSARKFQTTTGIDRFLDSGDMASSGLEPDRFYYDQALRIIENERSDQPLFVFVYTVFNHFPWQNRPQPELTPDWSDPGNDPEVDEYLRRQTLSKGDYADFKRRLKQDYPDDSFLLLRFGDHQPSFASKVLEPGAGEAALSQRMTSYDPLYFTTYYAVDTINYSAKDLSSALDRLEATYLPLVVLEAAGLPLDPSFAEQKKILLRCNGLFFNCADGAEARRFNRLLIDAGLIKGMVSR